MEILINSQRGKISAEFYGKWGIRVECTVRQIGNIFLTLFLFANLGAVLTAYKNNVEDLKTMMSFVFILKFLVLFMYLKKL